jgi:endonuclease YncB( thermonuclease family)
MDETRKLHSTNAKPPVIPTRTLLPATSTPPDVPASPIEPSTTPVHLLTITPTTQASCIPANAPAIARVLEIVDGNTIKVYMNELVYVVRYIGVDVPQDSVNSRNAYLDNSELVFRKDVTLIADAADKDADGRLLRYVLIGDTFVNLQLIQDGWGKAIDIPPNSSCAQTFKAAQESALQSAHGIWATPVP